MEFGVINASHAQINSTGANNAAHAAPDSNPVHKAAPVAQSDGHNQTAAQNNGSGGGAMMGEQRRKEMVQRGSDAISQAFQPKMVRFAIFKGPDGNFITRFTDLSDGSVRYIPEPEILDFMQKLDGIEGLLDTSA